MNLLNEVELRKRQPRLTLYMTEFFKRLVDQYDSFVKDSWLKKLYINEAALIYKIKDFHTLSNGKDKTQFFKNY